MRLYRDAIVVAVAEQWPGPTKGSDEVSRSYPRSPFREQRLLLVISCAIALVACPGYAQYHIYWGDVHGHTSISDGKGSVDECLTYARDSAGLDFVIVTDHDFGNAWPWHMPREAWEHTQKRVDARTEPGRFIAIVGYEWTSQPKYWTDVGPDVPSERLFPGPPRFYNHKNVYFPSPVPYLFSAKDPATMAPDLLAEAVRAVGGLIQNNHPSADKECADQFEYAPSCYSVITNTEMDADDVTYQGKVYHLGTEQVVRGLLNRGGKTGFVKGTDTHEGKPAARTAVLARDLTRESIFDALRHRRCYAVSNARVVLDFRIDGHPMGEEIEVDGWPRLLVAVRGTAAIDEVAIVRDGVEMLTLHPGKRMLRFVHEDRTFTGSSYYYVRVTQAGTDENGNPSRAWASPIWVRRRA